MRKEIIETGKTVEEAIDAACTKLGCERDQIEWEILDLPKKGFLGLKNIPARVKVWTGEDDAPAQEEAPVRREEAPAKHAAQEQQPKDKPQPREERKPQEKPAGGPQQPREERMVVLEGDVKNKANTAIAYLDSVCRQMGLSPTFRAEARDGGVCINVEGDGLGAMIGRRGETLDALQYLAGLVANRLEGEYLRLTVDCGEYRQKRRVTLEALAKKLSAQVLKTNVSKTLEPMNPFERRIIHATVSEIEGVSSTSIGEEPNRRVVITSPTARQPRPARSGERRPGPGGPRPPRDSRDGGRDRRDGGGRDRRPPRSGGGPPRRDNRRSEGISQGGSINTLSQNGAYASSSAEPKKTPEATSDKPLYTKLDLE